jgi:hypothetical protein
MCTVDLVRASSLVLLTSYERQRSFVMADAVGTFSMRISVYERFFFAELNVIRRTLPIVSNDQ